MARPAGPPPALPAHEGLAQGVQLVGGHYRAVVAYGQAHGVRLLGKGDLDPAAGGVVAHRVAQQVGDGLAQQHRVAVEDGGAQVVVHAHVVLVGLGGERRQLGEHHGLQVHLLVGQVPGLGVGQVQQGVDRLHIGAVGPPHAPHEGPQVLHRGVGVGQGHVDHGLGGGQGRAQLVGGVGGEPTVRGEGALQGVQHAVKGVRQVVDLVTRPGQGQALAEVARGGTVGHGVHGGQGPQHTAGQHPAHRPRDDRQQHQGHDGRAQHAGQQVEQVGVHPGRLAGDLDLHARRRGGARALGGQVELDIEGDQAGVEVDHGNEHGPRGGHQAGVGQGQAHADPQAARPVQPGVGLGAPGASARRGPGVPHALNL